jgi:ABC-type uncharacterized transport system substrate-binding protein
VKRREFVTLLGSSVAAWPLASRAQPSGPVRRIGVLTGLAEGDVETSQYIAAFRDALQDLGWRDGQNVRIDYRWAAGDPERIRSYAAEMARLAPDVIFVTSPTALSEMIQATGTIPIVFVQVADPVAGGYVASLANPGGNVTGFTSFEDTMASKWLELLSEMVPRLTKVAIFRNPAAFSASTYILNRLERGAQSLGVKLLAFDVRSASEIDQAFESIGRESPDGLIAMPDAIFTANREKIVALAAQLRLPAVYYYRYYAASGGLMSYGPNAADFYKRAASYVDRILKGAKPANLPVEQPTKFELVVNLKTARALGLVVPPGLLLRADEVIE